MEETKKPIWMIIITVVITAVIIGGGIYYWQNKKLTDSKDDLNNQITSLQKQVNDLKTASTPVITTPSTSTPTTAATTTPASSTVSGTEDWKTYTSSSDNYSIKYPKSWIYDSTTFAGSIVFRGETDGQWLFQLSAATTNKTLQQNVDAEKTSNTNNGCSVETSDATVGGQTAVKLSLTCEGGYGDTETLAVYSGKLYTLSQGVGTDQDESNMVKTFQFTE